MTAKIERLSRSFLLILAGIGALGSLATHMFVPAMPLVARSLSAKPHDIQLAVTLYLVGLGLGQLLSGPIADRLGRRPVMLAGMVLFVAGSIACAIAQSVELLLAARFVQALGGAAAILTARTIVSDLSPREEVSARLASMITVVLISPAVAPIIGGFIAGFGSWRLIFALLAIAGLIGLAICFFRIPETLADRTETKPARLRNSYARLLSNPRFCRYAIGIACSSCALYIFLSGSAFLLIEHYRLAPQLAGGCYLLVAICGISGTLAVGRLERKGGAFRVGLGIAAIGGALMVAFSLAGMDNVVALMGPMMVMGFGTGIAAPSGIAGAMHAEHGLEGTASSLAGALQMVVSGATTSIIAQIGMTSLSSLAEGIFVSALLGLLIAPRGRSVS